MNYATCKGKDCGAEIIWIKTENDKNHPVDRKPEKMWVMTLSGRWKLVDCYRSHFGTCPAEAMFRKDKT